jgi:hypothetical protein
MLGLHRIHNRNTGISLQPIKQLKIIHFHCSVLALGEIMRSFHTLLVHRYEKVLKMAARSRGFRNDKKKIGYRILIRTTTYDQAFIPRNRY